MSFNYTVQISGEKPASAETILKSSARNAAVQGLNLRAEPAATATITEIATGKVETYRTNECGVAYLD